MSTSNDTTVFIKFIYVPDDQISTFYELYSLGGSMFTLTGLWYIIVCPQTALWLMALIYYTMYVIIDYSQV